MPRVPRPLPLLTGLLSFGVIGVILFVKLLPKILRVDIRAEEKRLEALQQQQYPEIKTAVFRVSNPNAFDKSLADLQIRTMTGAVISRLVH